MAKRGSQEWKINIKKGVSNAWVVGKYKDVDFSKSEIHKLKISEQHKGMRYSKEINDKKARYGKDNGNYGKRHIGLNKGHKYNLGSKWNESAKLRLRQKLRDNPNLNPNRRMAKLRFGQSKPQYKLYLLIKKQYSDAELEYPIITQYSTRFADIAIPSLKLDIEYDGEYWHKNKELDDIRTKHINDVGWTVIRFNKNNFGQVWELLAIHLNNNNK